MISNQFEKCKVCGRDKKYVKFTANGEKLVCLYYCEKKD